MAKTWIWSDEAQTSFLEDGEGLESLTEAGSLVFLTAGDAVIATAVLATTNSIITTAGSGNVQKSAGGGFNAFALTPSADGTVTKAELRKSDTTLIGTAQVRRTDAGDAADAVFTFNSVDWNTLTDVTFNSDFLIVYP